MASAAIASNADALTLDRLTYQITSQKALQRFQLKVVSKLQIGNLIGSAEKFIC